MAVLDIKNIHTYYGESHILHGLSLQVEENSIIALLGRNGMGKTTTIRSIIGFNPPSQGEIIFNGRNITGLRPDKIARTGIGIVPQGRDIFKSLSVEENLKLGARDNRRPDAWTIDKVYSLFPILKKRAGYKGNLLSGGEQQMLAIGRALLTNPKLLLMDEPSEGLAPIIVKQISQIILKLKETGFSILLVEQNISEALKIADYVYILSKGVVVHQCSSQELREHEEIKIKYLSVYGKDI